MPKFTRFLILEASQEFGFVTQQTLNSDRCQLQLVKSLMMLNQFEEGKNACKAMLDRNDRNCEAWILYGECAYRMAMTSGDKYASAPEEYDVALDAFETALSFLSLPPPDPETR